MQPIRAETSPSTAATRGMDLPTSLLAIPSSGSRDFPRNLFGETINNYHFYVQDDYKVSSRLTLNLGLRYEFNPQPAYFQDQSSWFDPLTGQIAVSLVSTVHPILTTQQVAKYAYPQFKQYFVTPTASRVYRIGLLFNQHDNWAPRIGLAFRPSEDNKTVIRAGFGVFYLLQSGNNTVSQPILNLPFIVDESIVAAGCQRPPDNTRGKPVPAFQLELFLQYALSWPLSIRITVFHISMNGTSRSSANSSPIWPWKLHMWAARVLIWKISTRSMSRRLIRTTIGPIRSVFRSQHFLQVRFSRTRTTAPIIRCK